MNPLNNIKTRLQKYPQVRYESDATSIYVLPDNPEGFTVGLAIHTNSFTVSFNGWHEEFAHEDGALNCFAFGLSSACRLKEHQYGDVPCRWTVEAKRDGQWVEDSTTGLLVFPFWRKKTIRYLQNSLIEGTL